MQARTLLMSAVLAIVISACASTQPQRSQDAPPAIPAAIPAAKPATATNLSGEWMLTVETPMGARDMKLTATQTGETLTGTIANPRGDSAIAGTVKGSAVAFSMKINAQGQDVQIDYAGTIEGDSMKGTAQFGSFGSGTFTGKRQQ